MKNIFAIIMAVFLVLPLSGFSMDKNHKSGQTAKIVQHSGRSSKSGRKPPKARAARKIHKSKTRRPLKKSSGNKILI
jgi:uncharacterized protein YxeA